MVTGDAQGRRPAHVQRVPHGRGRDEDGVGRLVVPERVTLLFVPRRRVGCALTKRRVCQLR
jgi:hypothetical protein